MEMRIGIETIIESPSALTVEQGKKVYEVIKEILDNGNSAILDFQNIESIITPFLNEAIGRLYKDYSSEKLQGRIRVENQPEGTNKKINMVARNAKIFYADEKSYIDIVKKVSDEK